MAYTQITEIRNNSAILANTSNVTDAIITHRITLAEEKVQTDLGNFIDFSLVPSDSDDINFPTFLNLLTRCKATELTLIYMFAQRREAQDDQITYWKECYDKMIHDIKLGKIPLELDDGTSIKTGTNTFSDSAKDGIEPALGLGKWGQFRDKEDLLKDRPVV